VHCHIVTAVKNSKSDIVTSVFTKFSLFGLEVSTLIYYICVYYATGDEVKVERIIQVYQFKANM
jgi:hypothetical protein